MEDLCDFDILLANKVMDEREQWLLINDHEVSEINCKKKCTG